MNLLQKWYFCTGSKIENFGKHGLFPIYCKNYIQLFPFQKSFIAKIVFSAKKFYFFATRSKIFNWFKIQEFWNGKTNWKFWTNCTGPKTFVLLQKLHLVRSKNFRFWTSSSCFFSKTYVSSFQKRKFLNQDLSFFWKQPFQNSRILERSKNLRWFKKTLVFLKRKEKERGPKL